MAQHRTKQDKIKASIHRVESSKLYSLSELDSNTNKASTHLIQKTKKSQNIVGINVKTVKTDLKRTGISLAIVLALLALGFFYLG